jgi:thiamine biosynthesis lipoprotein
MRTKTALFILIILLYIVSLTACSSTEQFFVFGTFLDVTVEGAKGDKAIRDANQYMEGLEALLSPTVEGSDLYKINNAKAGEVVSCSEDTMALFAIAETLYTLTDGAYDPTIYPLVRLWNFSGDKFSHVGGKTPPSDSDINQALALVGFDRVFAIDHVNGTVVKNAGFDNAMVDFGGMAKGYAVERLMRLIDQKALINLGGNIGANGKDYTIGIGNPRESATAYYGSFTLRQGQLISTSGDYERCFFHNGERYHHILNPSTGKPSNSGLISVSVICEDGAVGDALSTAIMVVGAEKGKQILSAVSEQFDLSISAILIFSDLNYEVVGSVNFVKKV